MQTTAAAFGQQFSAPTVLAATRLARINSIINAAYELQMAINKEICAEDHCTGNPALAGEGEWDIFVGNGQGESPAGLNTFVQTAGEALFAAIDSI